MHKEEAATSASERWMQGDHTLPPCCRGCTAAQPASHPSHRMLMLALARAANMVAATPRRLAIFCPTTASTQQSCRASTAEMRPAWMASLKLHGG